MPETPRKPRTHVRFERSTERKAAAAQPAAGDPGTDGSAPGPKAKPRIQVTRPSEAGPWSPGFLLGILALAALVGVGIQTMRDRPDPHFVTATKLVSDYERGRAEEERNYGNTIYEQALGELSRVPVESGSFDEAHALHSEIVNRRERFFAEVRKAEKQNSERRSVQDEKRSLLAAKQAHSRLHPRTEYPECDE